MGGKRGKGQLSEGKERQRMKCGGGMAARKGRSASQKPRRSDPKTREERRERNRENRVAKRLTVLREIGVRYVLPRNDDAALGLCVDGEVHIWELSVA